eukprot:1047084-Amphidinium_carterae.1
MGCDGSTLCLHLDLSVCGISRGLLEGDVLLSGLCHFRILIVIIQWIVENRPHIGDSFRQAPVLILLGDLLSEKKLLCQCVPTSNLLIAPPRMFRHSRFVPT